MTVIIQICLLHSVFIIEISLEPMFVLDLLSQITVNKEACVDYTPWEFYENW